MNKAALRLFKRRLTNDQVQAFHKMAHALIYLEPTTTLIGHTTISEISQIIQKDFLVLFSKHNASLGNFEKSILIIVEKKSDVNTAPQPAITEKKLSSNYDGINRATVIDYWCQQVRKDDAQLDYFEWASLKTHLLEGTYDSVGFSPFLCQERKSSSWSFGVQPNCCGIALMEGTLSRLVSEQVYLAITPHHPVVILHKDNLFRRIQYRTKSVRGYIVPKETFYEYRPSHEDNVPSPLALILDFDRAVLYEILENIEFLRQVSLGTEDMFLPNSRERFEKIAEQHREVLQLTDWKKLQSVLFPDITEWLESHEDEWNYAIAWAKRWYFESHVRVLIKEYLDAAQSAAFKEHVEFKDAQKKMLDGMKPFNEAIKLFFENSQALPSTLDPQVATFVRALKGLILLGKESAYVQSCLDFVIATIFDKEPFQ